MTINLQIEQLVLEAIDLAPGQRARLQAAVEAELSRILTTQKLPAHLKNGGTFPNIPITLELTHGANPTQMGQSIARSVYKQMAQPVSPPGKPSTNV